MTPRPLVTKVSYMKKLLLLPLLILAALMMAAVTVSGTISAAEPVDFEPVPLTAPQCPSGWYPESYDAAREYDPNRCIPFDPCHEASQTTWWTLQPCNPFVEPDATELPVFTFDVPLNEWVVTDTVKYEALPPSLYNVWDALYGEYSQGFPLPFYLLPPWQYPLATAAVAFPLVGTTPAL